MSPIKVITERIREIEHEIMHTREELSEGGHKEHSVTRKVLEKKITELSKALKDNELIFKRLTSNDPETEYLQ